jgi:hypothetical protein
MTSGGTRYKGVLKQPPKDFLKVVEAHVNEGWSYTTAHRKFGISYGVWCRWVKQVPEVKKYKEMK